MATIHCGTFRAAHPLIESVALEERRFHWDGTGASVWQAIGVPCKNPSTRETTVSLLRVSAIDNTLRTINPSLRDTALEWSLAWGNCPLEEILAF